MVDRKRYSIKGIPNDILTNDIVNDRRFKVESQQDPDVEFTAPTYQLLASLLDVNIETLNQIKLLNARFEEMAETHINEQDIKE